MRRIGAIAHLELKRVFQNPQSYLIMFGMPILFTVIFGGMLSGGGEEGKPLVAVVDEDQTIASASYLEKVQASSLFEVKTLSREEAQADLDGQSLSGYVWIQPSFETSLIESESPNVSFFFHPSVENSGSFQQVLENQLVEVNHRVVAASEYQSVTGEPWETAYEKMNVDQPAGSGVQTIDVIANEAATEMDTLTARSTGFAIMFVMIAMLSRTGGLLEARRNGVWDRLMSTPALKRDIVFGYVLAFFLIGWIQFGLLMVISSLVFGVYWGSMLGNVILVSVLLLCTIGLGLAIAGFVKTSEQQSILGNLIIISTCMISGVYWPKEIMPSFMQEIAAFIPQTWALEGFTELAVRAGTLTDIFLPIVILLAFTVVLLSIGVHRTAWK
ncbi:ABC transporter permease [Halobacillus fulvus]|nr:ABC transporter permease [Halobacillus fulvus]